MRAAIMQPYFMPYLGYFQLIGAADIFVLYDNIKYTKKGWINRNRYLRNGRDAIFSLPLTGASDTLDIGERTIAADFDRQRLLNRLAQAYRQAPMFAEAFPLVEAVVRKDEPNLFRFLHHSLAAILDHLGVSARIAVSSDLPIDHSLRGQEKVIALCRHIGATTYVNAPGGRGLYAAGAFAAEGIELRFLDPRPLEYRQFQHDFVPWLSIIDVLMFNPVEKVREHVRCGFDLV